MKHIVIISTMDFSNELSAKRYALLLSQNHKVLYVNRQIGIEHKFINKLPRFFKSGVKQILENLYVYTPPAIFTLHNMSKGLNYIEQKILSVLLKKKLTALGFNNFVLLLYQHNSYPLIQFLQPLKSAYIIIDEFAEIASGYRKKVICAIEKKMIESADFVLCASKKVILKKSAYRKDILHFPSAVDTNIFNDNSLTNFSIKKIGIIGTFDDRIDQNLLLYLIDNLPDYEFNLIGSGELLPALAKKKNVLVKKNAPYETLPHILKDIPIMLIPYLINIKTNSISSLKLIEYLALNKFIISSETSGSIEYSDYICIAKKPEDWIENIINAEFYSLKKQNPKDTVLKNSYTKRIEFLLKILEK